MTLTIRAIAAHEFPLYDAIPMRFEVTSCLRIEVTNGGLGGFHIQEEPVVPAYIKDYDATGDDSPTAWARDFDISRWGIFLAEADGRAVGGATVAIGKDRPFPMDFCQGDDLAALVDIRVHPDARQQGIGTALFRHAAEWSRQQGCKSLGLETQSVNVPACRFYLRQGCTLGAVHRFGYRGSPDMAHEAMLLWYLEL